MAAAHNSFMSVPFLNVIPIKLYFNPDVLSYGHGNAFDMSLCYR